jgi:HSP20 family protein
MNTSVLHKPVKKNSTSRNRNGIDQLINDVLFGDQIKSVSERIVRPNANIIDREKELILELAVPGISKKDIQLQIQKMQLKVSAKPAEDAVKDSKKYLRKAFDYARFERNFNLSEEIDMEAIEAKYANGVLSIHLPKKESFGPKQILIK